MNMEPISVRERPPLDKRRKTKERGNMEMYREQYATCIIVDGKVQPEKDGVVTLPFGSEYKVRLRNKSRIRSVGDIYIDGEVVVKGVVLDADGKVDIERHLEGFSLNGGPKFKLARLSDPKVKQPGESQNGLLEVRFYREKPAPKVTHTYHQYHGHYFGCNCPDCNPWGRRHLGVMYDSLGTCEGIVKSSSTGGSCLRSQSLGTKISASLGPTPIGETHDCFTSNASEAEAAATVEGGHSGQSFTSIYMDIDKDSCVTLSLKLMGVGIMKDTCDCGRKRKEETYCPDCGVQLVS